MKKDKCVFYLLVRTAVQYSIYTIHTHYSVYVSVLGTYQMLNLREYTVNVQIQHMFRSLVLVKKQLFSFSTIQPKIVLPFPVHCYKKIQPKKYL